MSDYPDVPVTALPDDSVVLDIREQAEWDAGHAPGKPMETANGDTPQVP